MSDDASRLRAAWLSEAAASEDNVRTTVDRVLEKDRADCARQRRLRVGGVVAMLSLVPVLVWAAAYGVSPVVRAAYALMAIGCTAGVVAEWLYLEWSRRAFPGPSDTSAQLRKTAFMLECQTWLAKTAVVWASPVFIGVLLICVWLYRERTVTGAVALCTLNVAAWIGAGVLALRTGSALERRKRQLKRVLADLRH